MKRCYLKCKKLLDVNDSRTPELYSSFGNLRHASFMPHYLSANARTNERLTYSKSSEDVHFVAFDNKGKVFHG